MDSDWRRWLYQKWNERLVEYCFHSTERYDDGPVERIPATPEELREVVGDPSAQPEEIVAEFVASVKRRIPEGVSFEGFCINYLSWSPVSKHPPRFFAMLWLTCLVAYGYPEGVSGFHDRMTKLLGRYQHMGCLPELWQDVEEWTRLRASNTADFKPLKLPPYDRYRSNIGHSWFLAFPHQHDRHKLRELLESKDLVGDEPPIAPVASLLERNRNVFSSSFKTDLDVFTESFLDTDASVRDSPFWRAVRQEALPPAKDAPETRQVSANTALMAALDDDELYVYVACSYQTRLPAGFSASDFDDEIDGFSKYVTVDVAGEEEDDGIDQAALAAFEGRLGVPKVRLHARRGVLAFQEVMTNEYRLAGGSDANQAEVALVRNDKVEAFKRAYRGRARPSRLPGWQQVTRCKVLVRPEPPRGLGNVKHLQETMVSPSVRLADGIRTEGGFYAFPGFLPVVRFDGATRVEIVDALGTSIGEARRSSAADNEWRLPEELIKQAPGEWTVRVYWSDSAGRARTSETKLVFVDRQTSHDYKRLGAGRYHIEACDPGEDEVAGRQEIPLGITAARIPEETSPAGLDYFDSANGSGDPPHWQGIEPDYRVGHFADALAALSVQRSGVRRKLLFDLFSTVLGMELRDNPVLFHDLVRGWVEAGTMDVALRQGSSASYVLARRPGFVAFRLGSRIRASLVGLVPSVLEARLLQATRARGARCENLLPPCEWLPKVVRVECDTPSTLQEISTDLELPPPKWLRWPTESVTVEAVEVRPDQQGLREDPVPDSFETVDRWDWYQGRFVREKRPSLGIRVQRRTHPERSSIYVVVVDGEDYCWSYIRNWPLLLAYLLDREWLDEDDPIFKARLGGPIVRPREADVYLPLPVGRLCTVLGDGLAGPFLSSDGTMVEGYRYPLGLGYRRALADWLSGIGCVGFDDEEAE